MIDNAAMRARKQTAPIVLPLILTCLACLVEPARAADLAESAPVVFVVHGGAGTIRKPDMTPELETRYRDKLTEGLLAGFRILREGGSGLDAVEATIRIFEDSPLFNAGRGAVFTADGENELDASIMDGATLEAGAVAAVTTVRHPISAARAVMERSPHVMLAGRGAEVFADSVGLEIVEPSFFYTERRWKQLEKARGDQKSGHGARSGEQGRGSGASQGDSFGTVGALALDRSGHLAAGTSTGGRTNKRFGRVGDSPIIGAGTYANDRCAVSGTGHGEYFIRYAVAYDICARMSYGGASLKESADSVILALKEAGGEAGVISLDADGNVAMPFNTQGMYRGYIRGDGVPHVRIYKQPSPKHQ